MMNYACTILDKVVWYVSLEGRRPNMPYSREDGPDMYYLRVDEPNMPLLKVDEPNILLKADATNVLYKADEPKCPIKGG